MAEIELVSDSDPDLLDEAFDSDEESLLLAWCVTLACLSSWSSLVEPGEPGREAWSEEWDEVEKADEREREGFLRRRRKGGR